jgi:hypothetical protein
MYGYNNGTYVRGLVKTSMLSDKLASLGFTSADWVYKEISGRWAYYPQLRVFAYNTSEDISADSELSVRTVPFLGNGTENSPYIISTVDDFKGIIAAITPEYDAEGVYYLVNTNVTSFDLTSFEFFGVGGQNAPFNGHFDGNYANFIVNINSTNNYIGLFNHIGAKGSVSRLSVSGSVSGGTYTGAVAGYNAGELSEVYSTASVSGADNTGGIAGRNVGTLSYAYNTGMVYGSGAYVGGVLGSNTGAVTEIYNGGRVSGGSVVGGVVGSDSGELSKAYYDTTVIEYYAPKAGTKPVKAVGNEPNGENVKGLDKESMHGLGIIGSGENQLDFTAEKWLDKDTNGMYDYYLQIYGFGKNINSVIVSNSVQSVRTIRFAIGNGSQSDPFIIRNEADMKLLSEISAEDSLTGIWFKVQDGVSELDLTDLTLAFAPIGTASRAFRGSFIGNGVQIKLQIDSSANYQGLFGNLGDGAYVCDVTVSGNVSGAAYVSGVAGYAYKAKIEDVANYAVVTAANYAGGIAGYSNAAALTRCYNMADVSGTANYLGGIAGYAVSTAFGYVFNYGSISGVAHVGGIAGRAETSSTVSYAYNRNNVTGTSAYVGGIIGYLNVGTLDNCYSAGTVRGSDQSYVGGIVGRVNGATSQAKCYYDASIIEADMSASGAKPIRSVGNSLDQNDLRGVEKTYITGTSILTTDTSSTTQLLLDSEAWTLIPNNGIDAFYPQLKVFAAHEKSAVKADSLQSVTSYIFAGKGEELAPYIIVNENDMKLLSDIVQSGNNFSGIYFKVRNNAQEFDMTLDGLDYNPVGNLLHPFNGYFDGSGTNFLLDLNNPSLSYQGLFGCLGSSAHIYRLSVSGSVSGGDYTGGIAGYNLGEISSVYSTAAINGKSYMGGIAGYNAGTIDTVYYIGTLASTGTYSGGLNGYNKGVVSNGYSVAKISGANSVGGIVGYSDGGTQEKLYYNTSTVELHDVAAESKPTKAVSNLDDTDICCGKTVALMTSGTLGGSVGIDLPTDVWTAKKPYGFELYYPQITFFASNSQAKIAANSVYSVTIARFTEGDGTENNPYIIRTATDMKAVSELVLSNKSLEGKYFKVADDVLSIDLTEEGVNYLPIGYISCYFQGSFDGSDATFVLGLSSAGDYQGLFGFVGEKAVIRNCNVTGSVSGRSFTGGIAGRNRGLIENCTSSAEVTASQSYSGGITGYNEGSIAYCYNTNNISAYNYAGGIVGGLARNATVSFCYNTGNITTSAHYAGGIVGYAQGTVSNTYSAGEISGQSCGGVIGVADGYATVYNSYYDKSIVLFSSKTLKPVNAIGNITNTETVLGLATAQMSGDSIYGVVFDEGFVLKPNSGYTAYYPQLKVFADSEDSDVKSRSLQSVTGSLFRGEGTEENPYYMLSSADMRALAVVSMQGTETENIFFKSYYKGYVFDLSDKNLAYYPVGISQYPFKGNFDGNSSTFKLAMTSVNDCKGLFGVTGESAVLSNFFVTGSVSGGSYTGAAAGLNAGTLSRVYVTAAVSGKNYTGGIVGFNRGSITDSYFKGEVASDGEYTGGIAGVNDSNAVISYSYNFAYISSNGSYAGGLVGRNAGGAEIVSSYNHGSVSVSGSYAGGLAALNEGSISFAYSTADISAVGKFIGGLAANNSGVITEAYSSGELRAAGNVGGVAAVNTGTLERVYYNTTEIENMVPDSYVTASSAVFNNADTDDVKGLPLDNMTGVTAIADSSEYMNFTVSEWSLKDGQDFVSYFPEMNYFKNSEDSVIKADSLVSITDKKLEGSGTSQDPYLIYDGFDMRTIGIFVLKGKDFAGKYFKVADGVSVINLTYTSLGYTPIGSLEYQFNGILDGRNANFVVKIDNEREDYQGIFHTLGTGAKISNMTISGTVIGNSYIGGLAGRNLGSVSNVVNNATVQNFEGNNGGGITGFNEGTISDCVNYGTVSVVGTYAGGIAGDNAGTITRCYNKGAVSGNTDAGGIAGRNYNTITYCYNNAKIKAQTQAGGIAGENDYVITHCFNMGAVEATVGIAGGISAAQVYKGYGQAPSMYVVYNTGSVTTAANIAGGILGYMTAGNLYDAYNGGDVSGYTDLGTILGRLEGGSVSRAYYDTDALDNFGPIKGVKPDGAIGSREDSGTVKGLYHGQMAGASSINKNTMNFSNTGSFVTTPSYEQWSFYPQIAWFANNSKEEITVDSLESVRGLTFVVGSGTKGDPYIIRNESDLIALAETVNSGNKYENVYFMVDPDVSEFDFYDSEEGYPFTVIGDASNPFKGNVNFNGANVKLNLSRTKYEYTALFGHIGSGGTVSNVSVSGVISGGNYTAGIAALNEGVIKNAYNTATINGKKYTAGIAAVDNGEIFNVYNRGDITGTQYTGGIAGYIDGYITNSYNNGVIYGTADVGAIAGFLDIGLVLHSYYDALVLSSYRNVGSYIKPERGVANSVDSETVKDLDKQFMTGLNAMGTGEFQMYFEDTDNDWSVDYNVDGNSNYPQLRVFSRSSSTIIRDLSKQSTLTTLYRITYDYNEATEDNTVLYSYAINGKYYQLNVPFRFGFEFIGWDYVGGDTTHTRLTDGKGASLSAYAFEEDIVVVAQWQVAVHTVRFIDGNGNTVYTDEVLHGDFTFAPDGVVPTKNPSKTLVYFFDSWNYDFSVRIVADTNIYANYTSKDRYYKLTYLDGNGSFFKESKVEYGTTAEPVSAVPSKLFVDETAYKFTGWDFDFSTVITQNYEIKPIFVAVERWYTVSFVNWDGTPIEEQEVEYLKAAIAPQDKPVKDPLIDTVYTFTGWDKEFGSITEDMTVTAVFSQSVRRYEVRFLDGDGYLLSLQNVEYGTSAAEPSQTPVKAAHDDIAYKFTGWDGDFSNITGDLVVRAQFTEIDRYYTVVFVNHDGSELKRQTVEYLSAADAPEETPVKDASEMYVYTFKGWDKSFDKIESDLTVTALYDESLRPFTVTFYDGDGNVFSTQTVLYGNNASTPQGIPRKTASADYAYKFTGWQGVLTNVTEDRGVHAQFTEVQKYYIVTFYGYDASLVLKSEKVEYGYAATAPEAPIQTHSNIAYEYYFVNWNKDFSYVESDLTVTAVYAVRIKTFTVTFVNGDETTYQTVNYGGNAVAPAPYKAGSAQVSYTFVKWDRDYTGVTENITVTAIFEAKYNYYIVQFLNGDGSVMSVQHIAKGGDAIAPSSPFKAPTATSVFVFKGWDKTFEDVESDLVVTSLFTEKDRYYKVIFTDENGVAISEQTVEYAHAAVPPTPPQKLSTQQYDFVFLRWNGNYEYITEASTFKPVYESVLRSYPVVFYDGDGNIVSSQTVEYGKSAKTPADATKTPTDTVYYVFDSWDTDYFSITGNTEVHATFKEVDRWYTVTFIGANGIILDEQTVEYGKDAVDPIRELPYEILDDEYIIAITGWDKEFSNIKSDLTVNAVYEQVERWYTVEFYNEDGSQLLKTQEVEYGNAAIAPAAPEKASDSDYFYTFKGWDKEFDFVTSDLGVKAVYEAIRLKYTVTFYDGNGNIFDRQTVFYGQNATQPNGIPTKTPTAQYQFDFTGWDKELTNVVEDRVITALFEQKVRTYIVRFVDTNGGLLKEQYVEYGKDASPPEGLKPPESTEQYNYQIGWSASYKNISQNMEIQLVYIAVTRQYTYTFLDADGKIIKTVTADYGTVVSVPAAPAKAMTEKYYYTFIGWNPEVEPLLIASVVYEPYYDEHIREYTVTFLDGDGKVFETQSVEYGSNGTLPVGTPAKTPTAKYYYVFKAWESYPNSIRSDTVIKSLYYEYLQKYRVTFVDEKDNVLKVQEVPYGTGATEPEPNLIPKKADTQMYSYTFAGWSRPFSNVTEDITVKTIYIGVLRSYTYTFYDDDGITVIKRVRAIYGSKVVAPPNPTKAGTESVQYTFIGWDKVVADTLVQNIEYYAVYKEIPRTFTVVFYDGNGFVLESQIVNYGTAAVEPSKVPAKTSTVVYQYTFAGWDTDFSEVLSDLKIYPLFNQELRDYTVTFLYPDGSSTDVIVKYGSSAYGKVATPTLTGYRFTNWDKDISVITKDITVKPVFMANDYEIKFYDDEDASNPADSMIATYGDNVALPVNSFEKRGYYFAGWTQKKNGQIVAYYADGQNFEFSEEGMELYADWNPIVYNITYELFGGSAVNPDHYTIEDEVVLQSAYKKDYKFLFWYMKSSDSQIQVLRSFRTMSVAAAPASDEGAIEQVEIIEPGNIGDLTLYAMYKFDGFIKLKDTSELVMAYSDDLNVTIINERTSYDQNNPVYLAGMELGTTAANIKSQLVNDNVFILDASGNQVADSADVTTGYQLVLYDENGQIKDKIVIVILGDINGDGYITVKDTGVISSYIKGDVSLEGAYKLAANLYFDEFLTVRDSGVLSNYIKTGIGIDFANPFGN